MFGLESVDVSKSLPMFRFVPLVDWLILSIVSKAIQHWFEQGDLWQHACQISAFESVCNQGANDVSCLTQRALSTIACKMLRLSLLRTLSQVLCFSRFPAQSPIHIVKHYSFWMLQRSDLVIGGSSLLGSKMWRASEMICAMFEQTVDCWPAGLAAKFEGSAVVEVGAGLGLFSVAVARFGRPARVVLTDGEIGCLRLAKANVSLNALLIAVETQILRFGAPTMQLKGAFDVVVASDVAYSLELVEPIWRSVKALLRKRDGTFIVGHMDRTPSSTARLLSCAPKQGFTLKYEHDLFAFQIKPRRDHEFAARLFIFERAD